MAKIIYEDKEYNLIILINEKENKIILLDIQDDLYYREEITTLTKGKIEKMFEEFYCHETGNILVCDKIFSKLKTSEFYKSLKDDEEKEKSNFRNNYFLNDEVYIVVQGKVVKGKIKSIHLCDDTIFYDIIYDNAKYRINDLTEECFYKTHRECLNSFIEKIKKENE